MGGGRAAPGPRRARTASTPPASRSTCASPTGRRDGVDQERSSGMLHVTAKAADERLVGRAFSSAAIELALANIPGFFGTSAPGPASAYGVYWPALVPADEIDQTVVLADGAPAAHRAGADRTAGRPADRGADGRRPAGHGRAGHVLRRRRRRPLGRQGRQRQRRRLGPRRRRLRLAGRDADGRAGPGAAARDRRPADPPLRAAQPPGAQLRARRLPRRGRGLVDRFDPQAKGLGEYLRSRRV